MIYFPYSAPKGRNLNTANYSTRFTHVREYYTVHPSRDKEATKSIFEGVDHVRTNYLSSNDVPVAINPVRKSSCRYQYTPSPFFLSGTPFSLVFGLDYGKGGGGGGGDGCADGCGDGRRQVKGKKSSGVDGQEIEGRRGSTGRQVMYSQREDQVRQ